MRATASVGGNEKKKDVKTESGNIDDALREAQRSADRMQNYPFSLQGFILTFINNIKP